MELDPKVPPYSTSDKLSFAHVSAKDRWPVILTGAIDDVHRSVSSSNDPEAEKEGKSIIEQLAKLKYELQHDRQISRLEDDGYPDIKGYNQELENLGSPTWFNVPWLYAECYLYRRIATYFTPTTHWRTHDIFSRQKLSTFASSRPAVLELAARYSDLLSQLQQTSTNTTDSANAAADTVSESDNTNEASRLLFTEVCEICLWGNATDLSLLTNLTYTDIQALQGSSARKSQEANILVNDLPSAFSHLLRAQAQKPNAERRVDIVLDNAGFELFVDLVLAGYLLEAGLATQIVLHPKSIPWFVSDVTLKDFGALLNALADPQRFYRTVASDGSTDAKTDEGTGKPLSESEEKSLKVLFEHWSTLHAEGRLVIRPNRFWTHAGSYWRMPTIAPELYRDLQESELVIFKGDLNYRKLTGDCAWDVRTGFQEAIGPLAGGGGDKGLNVLALRTCKADVVVGLGEGVDERVKATEGGGGDSGARRWAWSGKWALVQSSLH